MGQSNPRGRRSIRLKGYDYSQAGAYFVTAVTWQRSCLFGEILAGEMKLNDYGEIVLNWWNQTPVHFPIVETGAFVVMPNHIHGIIVITGHDGIVPAPNNDQTNNFQARRGTVPVPDAFPPMGERTSPLRTPTLGQIVAYFKYQSTKEMNALDGSGRVTRFWQRNYYEHIIRNEREMDRIWRYIESNPSRWADDNENPLNGR